MLSGCAVADSVSRPAHQLAVPKSFGPTAQISAGVEVVIDLLLACETIREARDETQERLQAAGSPA